MTSIPTTITRNQITLGDRARTVYSGIDSLAEGIEETGLIQPLILVPTEDPFIFKLDAGGRRLTALDQLLAEGKWDGVLHHAISSAPGRPGFVLRVGEAKDELTSLLIELAENLDRENFDWRDEAKLVAKAFAVAQRQAHLDGREVDMRIFSAGLKCGYNDLRCAVAIKDLLVTSPELFKDCTTVRNAYTVALKEQQKHLEKLLAERRTPPAPVVAQPVPTLEGEATPEIVAPSVVTVRLSEYFFRGSGLDLMRQLYNEGNSVDHIISDPDYGVAVDQLEASVSDAAAGVAQRSVDQTLYELQEFWKLAAEIVKGTVCIWFDMDHWEKLRDMAVAAGFIVQRWPIIWHKTDYNSNAAPQFNTTKDFETCLIARQPGVPLYNSGNKVTKSVWSLPSGNTTKEFGHPFAKPRAVWTKLLQLVAPSGDTILDPFAGSCSSLVTAASLGYQILGSEIQEPHYNRGLLNLQDEYRRQLSGQEVTFA